MWYSLITAFPKLSTHEHTNAAKRKRNVVENEMKRKTTVS